MGYEAPLGVTRGLPSGGKAVLLQPFDKPRNPQGTSQHAELSRSFQQHLHGRGLPFRPTTGRTFVHGFQPVADGLQGDVRIRSFYRGDDRR